MSNSNHFPPVNAPSSDRAESEPEPPFLSVHTTVVLLAAVVIGIVVGCLTALAGTPVAAAVVAGMAAAGAGIPVLRSLIR
ncbi:hypothetical protein HEK616_77950 (plasmid) [Streptomyces nigrescens]|uniref:SpdD protein n=2 Tax=Streptomyces TaxID=1883 RepID=A0ABM8A6J8_STRNI|nr:hypothetical protein [Streptomyces nigrescens]MEE4418981.1 hypothetical protein [Streptomyces sp. DSM 41528]BDM74308.1 hypothetical protein HEK616_77950 [Streptomyces nigrescens]